MRLTGWLAELWYRSGWSNRCERFARAQSAPHVAPISRLMRQRSSGLAKIERLEDRSLLTTGPGDLLIYYGYPSLINNAASVSAAATQFAPYEYVVLGAGLEDVTHPDHANTQAIVNSSTTNSTKFFGYVDLGVSTNNYSISALQTKIDNWIATGVNGIFLDDYGYDFDVARARQNTIVDYVHSKGLPVVANGFFVNQVFSNAVDAAYNPAGTATHLVASDYYLFESYQVSEGNYVAEADWRAKADALSAARTTLAINVLAVTTDDGADIFIQSQFNYAWYSGVFDGYTGVGWGQHFFAADDNLAPFRTPPRSIVDEGSSYGFIRSNSDYLRKVSSNNEIIVIDASAHTGVITTGLDFGDAPDSSFGTGSADYQSWLFYGGASHLIDTTQNTLFMGSRVDREMDASPSYRANGDDKTTSPDDEDGLVEPAQDLWLTVASVPSVRVRATNLTGTLATLYGWIDYNRDGVFDNATERASIDVPAGTANGTFVLNFPTVPVFPNVQTSTPPGTIWARFRLSSDPAAANAIGYANDGEVEDYVGTVTLRNTGVVASGNVIPSSGGGTLPLTDFDGYGSSSVMIEDLNGIQMLAVGAMGDDTGGTDRGAIYMQTMNVDGSVQTYLKIASGVNGGPTLSNSAGFGSALASLGDLDGDGVNDLAVGAFTDSTGGTGRGAVYILFLNPNGSVKGSMKIASGTNGGPALANSDNFGRSVAAIGDQDGDGVIDLAVGAQLDDSSGVDTGALYILRMNSNGTVKSSLKLTGGANGVPALLASDYFGTSVTSLGDFNNDGVTDLAVGAPGDDSGSAGDTQQGAIYVLLLNANGSVKSSVKIASNLNGGLLLYAQGQFGTAVTSLGDLDADGVTDLAVGAPGDIRFQSTGTVHILMMKADGTVKNVHNEYDGYFQGGYYGRSVAAADFNHDGVTDITVGADRSYGVSGHLGALYVGIMKAVDVSAPRLESVYRSIPFSSLTNADTLVFHAYFSKTVTDVDPTDFIALGTTASITTVTPISGTSGTGYNVTLSGGDLANLNGTVSLRLSSTAVVNDLYGNSSPLNSVSHDDTYTVDNIAPVVTITPNGTVTTATFITFTFQYSQAVVGFNGSDVTVTNGTSSGVFTVDSDTYTVMVTPTAEGPVTIEVASDSVKDSAGNGIVLTSASVFYDIRPTMTVSTVSSTTNASPILFTIQFSKPVTGVDASDLTVSNGTKGTFTAIDADTYTLLVTPIADGSINVTFNGTAFDAQGIINNTNYGLQIVSDRTAPTLTITPNVGATNGNPITFSFQFSEFVSGFDASDINVTNGTKGTFTNAGSNRYTLAVTPLAEGTVSVSVGAGAALDFATNPNVAKSASVTSDRTVPTLVIT
ncbi:MAG: hypothetical protein JWN70_6566, partial [Planctomycetaceae bacterium]|nr:hypothetical protein [Planctomycetaceae bacterium]